MILNKVYVPARYAAKERYAAIVVCFLILFLAEGTKILGVHSETQSARTISDSEINRGDSSVNVTNVKNARGDEKHAQVTANGGAVFFWAVGPLCNHHSRNADRRSLEPKPCVARRARQEVAGLIAAPQNPESRKNTNTNLQFAEVESRTLMPRDLIGEQGENLWAGKSKQFEEQLFIQRSVGTMERVLQEREPPQPPEPKLDRGPPAQHD